MEDFVETRLASCVGYFDRAYYRFYMTSSRMLVRIDEDRIDTVSV